MNSAALSSILFSRVTYDELCSSGSIKQEYDFELLSVSWDLWLLGSGGTEEIFIEGSLGAVSGTQLSSAAGCLKLVPKLTLARERDNNLVKFATSITVFSQSDFFLRLISVVMVRSFS